MKIKKLYSVKNVQIAMNEPVYTKERNTAGIFIRGRELYSLKRKKDWDTTFTCVIDAHNKTANSVLFTNNGEYAKARN